MLEGQNQMMISGLVFNVIQTKQRLSDRLILVLQRLAMREGRGKRLPFGRRGQEDIMSDLEASFQS